jgi:hypothetical protein
VSRDGRRCRGVCCQGFCCCHLADLWARDYAAKLAEKETLSSSEAVEQARKQGMEEMSAKFRAAGAEVYVKEE